MSIKTQKILCFIPIINVILTLLTWFKPCSLQTKNPLLAFKNIAKTFVLFFIITMIRPTLFFIFKNKTLDMVMMYVSIYLYFLVMSWGGVRAQEEILSNKNK